MEIIDIIAMFAKNKVSNHSTKNTSHGENDFRLAIFVKFGDESENASALPYDLVIKLADNDFTTPERLKVMRRTAQEYANLGYYCPQFFTALNGTFPYIDYQGHHCIAYAEEYSRYKSAEQFDETFITGDNGYYTFFDDAWIMNARIAAQHFDYTDLPSAYCLFDTFSPSDTTDEVMENAMTWYETAKKLPPQFSEQVERIWNRFLQNRNELAQYYNRLPSSVFQAALNKVEELQTKSIDFESAMS